MTAPPDSWDELRTLIPAAVADALLLRIRKLGEPKRGHSTKLALVLHYNRAMLMEAMIEPPDTIWCYDKRSVTETSLEYPGPLAILGLGA